MKKFLFIVLFLFSFIQSFAQLLIIKTAAQFTAANTLLLKNQTGQESDTKLMKFGNGVTLWNSLDYTVPSSSAFEKVLSGLVEKVPSSFAVQTAINTTTITAVAPLSLSSGTLTITQSGAGTSGYLSSTDWNTFNGKENVLTFTSPLTRSTNTVSIGASTSIANGYLSSADWTTFNDKQSTLYANSPLSISSNTISITSSLPLTNGGTNASLVASLGGIFYSTATAGAILSGTATAGQMLRSGASAAPTWSTNTFPNTTPVNQILHATAANVIGGSTTLLYDIINSGLIVGTTALPATTDVAVFYKNQNDPTTLKIVNNTSGTGGRAILQVTADNAATNLFFAALSAGFTTSGMFEASTGTFATSATAGLNVGTNVNTQFSFWTNNTKRASFLNTGELVIGTATSVLSGELLSVQKSSNASCLLRVYNATSGTAASAAVVATNAASKSVVLYSLSALYTTSGMLVQDAGVVFSNNVAGLNVGTNSNAQLSIWTNNTKKVEISAVGNMSLGGVATRGTTVGTFAMQIFDGTAPVGTLANGVSLYSASGILMTMNASGTAGKVGSVLTGSATLDFPSTVAGAVSDLTMTVTGAVDGDPVSIGTPNGSVPTNGTYFAWVSSANTVTVRFANNSLTLSIDPASGTFKATASKN